MSAPELEFADLTDFIDSNIHEFANEVIQIDQTADSDMIWKQTDQDS